MYKDDADREKMFATPELVFKDGRLIVRDGHIVEETWGATHCVHPDYERGIEAELEDYFDRYMTVRKDNLRVADDEVRDGGRGALVLHRTATS